MNVSRALLVLLPCLLLLTSSEPASAHRPYYEGERTAVTVTQPEISKAFYGSLNGQPVRFQIDAATQFPLYVNLLVPDVGAVRTDLSLQIQDAQGTTIATLNGRNSTWERWYEDFARDWYLKGPEFRAVLDAGNYTMTLSNGANQGKYVVAIGEKEDFPPGSIPSVLRQLVEVKTQTFQKPWYTAFANVFGLGIIGAVAVILTAGVLLYAAVRRFSGRPRRAAQ